MLKKNNNIVIDVYDYGIGCNCLCTGLVNYNITGLEENREYLFTFKRNGTVCYSANIKFTANVKWEDEVWLSLF
ncbi:MAG: hypothetical protein LBG92_05885 [Prevotellaceae bacterium]|jgi:hypothetical protein|nr:hypothetical protein [Prevotellaceae bacterium]